MWTLFPYTTLFRSVTEQELVRVAGRGQVPPEENVPEASEEKLTVPEGRDEVPESVSATVAVQVEAEFTGTEDGEQVTVVEVERLWTVMEKVPGRKSGAEGPTEVAVGVGLPTTPAGGK